MVHEREPLVVVEVREVDLATGHKVVDGDDLVASRQELLTEV